MQAMTAARLINAFCQVTWPDDTGMASTIASGWTACFNITSTGTHKYIPTAAINTLLGLPQGAGVWGYNRFADGSYLLLTCDGPLAVWDGETIASLAWA